MTYVPHVRVSAIGRLGGNLGEEMFSWGFALAKGAGAAQAPYDANAAVWTDVANDIIAFFESADMGLHADAVLQSVKIASIGADGKYTQAPIERLTGDKPGPSTQFRQTNPTALACTLRTAGDLNRVKGRFYLPLPGWILQTNGRYLSTTTEVAETRLKTFVNAINNQPGLDVLDLNMVVASQGRKNSDGSVRLAPANHLVTSVSVGRVPDTIRRRRNKLLEGHTYSTL